jgi:hypothetical protein
MASSALIEPRYLRKFFSSLSARGPSFSIAAPGPDNEPGAGRAPRSRGLRFDETLHPTQTASPSATLAARTSRDHPTTAALSEKEAP